MARTNSTNGETARHPHEDPPHPSPLRGLPVWPLLIGLYLALAGAVGPIELAAAALCGGAVTAVLRRLRREADRQFRFHPGWVMLAGRIARHVVADCAVVGRALSGALLRGRHIQGVFRELPWQPPRDAREAASLRALVTLGLSLAPNSYVVEIGEGPERMMMHHLVPPTKGSHDEVWLP